MIQSTCASLTPNNSIETAWILPDLARLRDARAQNRYCAYLIQAITFLAECYILHCLEFFIASAKVLHNVVRWDLGAAWENTAQGVKNWLLLLAINSVFAFILIWGLVERVGFVQSLAFIQAPAAQPPMQPQQQSRLPGVGHRLGGG